MLEHMPFSGVSCHEKENVCTVWWIQTHDNRTYSVELRVPMKAVPFTYKPDRNNEIRAEHVLEDILKDSVLDGSNL